MFQELNFCYHEQYLHVAGTETLLCFTMAKLLIIYREACKKFSLLPYTLASLHAHTMQPSLTHTPSYLTHIITHTHHHTSHIITHTYMCTITSTMTHILPYNFRITYPWEMRYCMCLICKNICSVLFLNIWGISRSCSYLYSIGLK